MHNQFKTQKFKHLMLAMGPRDLNSAPYSPVHCSSHSMTSFQSSELTELPVVENSQLFAQRAHSACTARAQRTVRPLWDHKLQDSHAPQQQVHRTFQATQGRVRKTLLVSLNTKQGPSPQNMVHTNSTPHNEVPTVKGMNMYTRTNIPLACSTYVGSKPPRITSDMGVTPAEAGVGRCQNCFRRMSAGVKNFFGRCWHVLKNISAAAGGCRQVFQQVLRPGMHHIARLTDVSYLSYQTQR